MLNNFQKAKCIALVKPLFFLMLACSYLPLRATHLMASYFEYTYIKTVGNLHYYDLKLKIYRDCQMDGSSEEVPFDSELTFCVYSKNGYLVRNIQGLLKKSGYALPQNPDNCLSNPYSCFDYGEYETTLELHDSVAGYYVKSVRCCRGHDQNLKRQIGTSEAEMGMTFLAFIPSLNLKNSNPTLKEHPLAMICYNDTAFWKMKYVDADGDSLSYELARPWNGASSLQPLVTTCLKTLAMPSNAAYLSGSDYGFDKIYGLTGVSNLNPGTGLLTLLSQRTGYFSASLDVIEWRDNKEINRSRLDFNTFIEFGLSAASLQTSGISIYPNPSSGQLKISGVDGEFQYDLKDYQGRSVLQGVGKGDAELIISQKKPGLYMIKITDTKGIQVSKPVYLVN